MRTDVALTPAVSHTIAVNPASVAICILYVEAPVDAVQERFGFNATPVAPFAGAVRTGGKGGSGMVVKFHLAEYGLVPPALDALTRQ